MAETIFSKIIAGEIPAHKIYEDNQVLAFLDIAPNAPGHALVIPKQPAEFVWEMDDDNYQYLMMVVKRLAKHLRATLLAEYVGVQIVGVDVPHAHVHLIPFNTTTEFFNHNAPQADQAELAILAEKLFIKELPRD